MFVFIHVEEPQETFFRFHGTYRDTWHLESMWTALVYVSIRIDTRWRTLYEHSLLASISDKTWWWPLLAETCSFLSIIKHHYRTYINCVNDCSYPT